MEFDLTDFDAAQQQAFFDLLILIMYADGHLSSLEDNRLRDFLTAMGHKDEVDQQRELAAALTRTRPASESVAKARSHLRNLLPIFTRRKQYLKIYQAAESFVQSDGHITSWESALLSEMNLKFRV